MGRRVPLAVEGQLWVSGAGVSAGHGRIALLRAIDAHGSISAAARETGMSYKAAWDAVDTMNNLAGKPLVIRETGGKGGGGTRLTEQAHALIAAFEAIETAHRRFVDDASRVLNAGEDPLKLLQRLSMKTSARNQFHGTVTAIRRGAVNDEIVMAIAGGTRLDAVITHESTSELGLRPGSDVIALVKASWVMLATGDVSRLSVSNRLPGTVSRITRGAVNAEVALALPGGSTVVAIVTHESINAMGLAEGVEATALVNASQVILAVPN